MIENTKATQEMKELNLEELDSVAGGCHRCHSYKEDRHRGDDYHGDDYHGDDYHGDDDYKGGGCKPKKPSWWYPGCRW